MGIRSVLGVAMLAAAIVAGATPAQDQPPAPGACVQHVGEVRYSGYGYDHIVVLDNRCDYRARCQVSTNVNPQVQVVEVPRGETREVVTFRGSPSREFTPNVSCDRAR